MADFTPTLYKGIIYDSARAERRGVYSVQGLDAHSLSETRTRPGWQGVIYEAIDAARRCKGGAR